MWIDATIAFGGVFLVGVTLFTLHWWLGRRERARREQGRQGQMGNPTDTPPSTNNILAGSRTAP